MLLLKKNEIFHIFSQFKLAAALPLWYNKREKKHIKHQHRLFITTLSYLTWTEMEPL